MRKHLLMAAGALTFAAGSALGYLVLRQPLSAPAPDINVKMTPERIARGRHLFHHVAGCEGCHSERDFDRFGGPVMRPAVGRQFAAESGLPGKVVAPNLTPDRETGLGRWSDGEKIRAIREGISRDGRALFPFMPYAGYRRMSDDDVQAIVAYLNSLKPMRNPLPRTELTFAANALMKSAPRPVDGTIASPDRSNPIAYGAYLSAIGGCFGCHTPKVEGQPAKGKEFAGGRVFSTPQGTVVSTNITPDAATGIGSWSESRFVQRFLCHREDAAHLAQLPPTTRFNITVMPWLGYSHLEREELTAIYAYLRSRKPVRNEVAKHPSPSRP
jgi:mono/diheme cytochrome c family protein